MIHELHLLMMLFREKKKYFHYPILVQLRCKFNAPFVWGISSENRIKYCGKTFFLFIATFQSEFYHTLQHNYISFSKSDRVQSDLRINL